MEENRTPPPTPEQLVAMLEAELAIARAARRPGNARRRGVLLAVGMFLILVICLAALLLARHLMAEREAANFGQEGGPVPEMMPASED